MRDTALRETDLRHYFGIKTDLEQAIRDGNAEDAAHHIDELEILAMYTDSARLKRACTQTVSGSRRIADTAA